MVTYCGTVTGLYVHIHTLETAGILLTFPGMPGGPLAPTSPWGERQYVHIVCILTTLLQLILQGGHYWDRRGRLCNYCNTVGHTARIQICFWMCLTFNSTLYTCAACETGCLFLIYLVARITFWSRWSLLSSFSLWKRRHNQNLKCFHKPQIIFVL